MVATDCVGMHWIPLDCVGLIVLLWIALDCVALLLIVLDSVGLFWIHCLV